MASMLCEKQLGGVVDIHDPNKIEELIIDGEDHIQTMYLDKNEPFLQRKKIRRPYSTPVPGYHGTMATPSSVDPEALIGHTLKLQDWLNEKSIKNIQEKSDLETKSTRKLYEDMLHAEDSFVKEMGDLVNHQELLDLRKKELLHKRWTDRVYQPIRRQIVTEAKSPEFGDHLNRKRQLHKEYLDHINLKGHVFLETFDPEEYYPMSLNPVRPGAIMARTKRLKDPLLNQERKRCAEDRIVIQCQLGSHLADRDIEQIRLPPLPLSPLGRHGTDASSWVAMPMGDIESPVRMASSKIPHRHLHTAKAHEKVTCTEKPKKWAWSITSPPVYTKSAAYEKSKQPEPDSHSELVVTN